MTAAADDNECPVCKDEYKDPRRLSCGHIFCRQCIESCMKKTCPYCRQPFTGVSDVPISLLSIQIFSARCNIYISR